MCILWLDCKQSAKMTFSERCRKQICCFPFLCSSAIFSPLPRTCCFFQRFLRIYFFQTKLIPFANTRSLYQKFILRWRQLTSNLMSQICIGLNPFYSGNPKKGSWYIHVVQTQNRRRRMRRLIRVATVCQLFSHFSLGIFKSHNLKYQKLNSTFPSYDVGEFIQSKMCWSNSAGDIVSLSLTTIRVILET